MRINNPALENLLPVAGPLLGIAIAIVAFPIAAVIATANPIQPPKDQSRLASATATPTIVVSLDTVEPAIAAKAKALAWASGGMQLASIAPDILTERPRAPTGSWPRLLPEHEAAIHGAAIEEALTPMRPANPVDEYLCNVYRRLPIKKDGGGDFTWKDPAAAKRKGMDVCKYVIAGMHRDFREQLYAAGNAMDRDGVNWTILSGFRDDWRQRIASGIKAGPCGSWHGGSCRTAGYGDGRAVDVWTVVGGAWKLFAWLDKRGREFGLFRPMPGYDPAHVQPVGAWNAIASALRVARTGVPETRIASTAKAKSKTAAKAKLAKKKIANKKYAKRYAKKRYVKRVRYARVGTGPFSPKRDQP